MGVTAAKDGEELTVHTMNGIHHMGPVFYASLPRDTETPRQRLVSTLWNHLVTMGSPRWKSCQSSNHANFVIQVVPGLLGRPQLLLGEDRGPAISFSEGGGKVWAALCGDASDVGIDVAGTEEFQGEYPFHRVFHPQELEHALRLADGDLAKASALLWSVKEAVVKALGCAFHLVDPLQITVHPATGEAGGHTFPVVLSGKALLRFPLVDGRSLWVRSLPQRKLCLSIALFAAEPGRP